MESDNEHERIISEYDENLDNSNYMYSMILKNDKQWIDRN